MRRFALCMLGAAACAAPATPTPAPVPAPTTAAQPAASAPAAVPADISDAGLRADLYAFAADSFRGRETGTPDADRAARFLAARLAAIGAEPAGDSGFFQRVPLAREYVSSATSLTVTEGGRTTRLALGESVVPPLSAGE